MALKGRQRRGCVVEAEVNGKSNIEIVVMMFPRIAADEDLWYLVVSYIPQQDNREKLLAQIKELSITSLATTAETDSHTDIGV